VNPFGFDDLFTDKKRIPTKKERRDAERFIKEWLPDPLGDVVEKLNNFQDSVENVQDALDPVKLLERKAIHEVDTDEAKATFQKGDHIGVWRGLYSHHGIYDGLGFVYEYDDFYVRYAPIEEFADGSKIYRINDSASYTPDEIIERAMSRMGEEEYNLLFNNCESFAVWCRNGT